MNSRELAEGMVKSVLFLLLLALSLYLLYMVRDVLTYIAIAGVLALIGRPFEKFLNEKLKFKTVFSSLTTLVVYLLLLAGLGWLFFPLIENLIDNLSLLDVNQFQDNMNGQLQSFVKGLNSYGIHHFDKINVESILSEFDFTVIPNRILDIVSSIGSLSVGVFSIFFITFFFLKEKDLFKNMILSLAPSQKEEKVAQAMLDVRKLLTNYFIGLLLQALIMFTLYFIILSIFGIENKIIIALICGLMNLIPYLGPLMGGVFIIFMSFSSMLGEQLDVEAQIFPNLIWILSLYIIAQLVDNVVNQPLIYSKSVQSHPLVIFLVLLAGAGLFGMVGLIIAVPVYTVIKVFLKEFYSQYKIVQSLN